MPITAADIVELQQLTSLYCHLIDRGETESFDRIYTEDATWDLSAIGAGVIEGLPAIREFVKSAANPIAHHLDCVYVAEVDGKVVVRSKVMMYASLGNVRAGIELINVVTRTDNGWRVKHRHPEILGRS